MFIVKITYKKSLDVVDQWLVAHRQYLDQGYQKNYFVTSGPQHPRIGGIIISQLKDRTLLESVLHQDPFYLNGVAEYEIIEFTPVKHHPDFAGFV